MLPARIHQYRHKEGVSTACWHRMLQSCASILPCKPEQLCLCASLVRCQQPAVFVGCLRTVRQLYRRLSELCSCLTIPGTCPGSVFTKLLTCSFISHLSSSAHQVLALLSDNGHAWLQVSRVYVLTCSYPFDPCSCVLQTLGLLCNNCSLCSSACQVLLLLSDNGRVLLQVLFWQQPWLQTTLQWQHT